MLSESPRSQPDIADLLVIGATTVDRFEPAREEPGGTPLHVARALAPRGASLAVMTAAGPEPAAMRGIGELRVLATALHGSQGPRSTTFRHGLDDDGRRRLWLEATGQRLDLPDAASWPPSQAILFAPIAGELDPSALDLGPAAARRGAILQGWLRASTADGEVVPLALDRLDPPLRDALGRLDLLVASREDLLAEAAGAREQVMALRRFAGPRPAIVVTDGIHDTWISSPGATTPERVEITRPIDGVATVGAGDIFAACLLLGEWPPDRDRHFLEERTRLASGIVADVLASRAGR